MIAAALKNWQTGILREVGILERKLAAKEDGAAIGFDPAGMLAVAAQARVGIARIGSGPGGSRHGNIFSGRALAFDEAESFKTSAAVRRISRDIFSSDTARASVIAPTSALKVKIALDLAARLFLPGSKPVIN